ncbi:MAG TPA: exodeoxyribonuclease VII large subunit [Planctomycetota bacterium]|nr:exodeoxyribonuclease VII large subunit [Planctomycetota bacterium]
MSAPTGDLFASREPRTDPAAAPESLPRVLSVRELTRRIEALVAGLGRVSVEGEVTRIMRAASGHVYFDLKDLDAKIACTIWKSQLAQAVRFDLKEGQQVVAHGKLDVYAPRGAYSLCVQRLEPAGIGALLVELEKRKLELKARGWFDRKRAFPALPRRIGVATSRDGAAFQDFLRTRTLRWSGYPLLLAHTPVQGQGASMEIARAIRRLDAAGVDVIVVCRGGGSLEDLWAFNELPVVEAIWNSRTPVVSGVGHEVDVTLADLVADVRAHTPTDAAQVVIPDREALAATLERARTHLARAIDLAASSRSERLERAANARVLRDPRTLVGVRRERLARLASRLETSVGRRVERARARLSQLERTLERNGPRAALEARRRRLDAAALRLRSRFAALLERAATRQSLLAARLESLSPTAVLARGYSITAHADGRVVRSARELADGETLLTELADGRVRSRVLGAPLPDEPAGS